MPPVKIAIVDDQTLFLKGLRLIISTFPDIEIMIEATNGEELLQTLTQRQPDVILLDLRMPVMDGVEVTERVKADYPDIKIILLTTYDSDRLINQLMKSGANGYLLKNEEPEVLQAAIHSVMEKGFYFNDHVSKALLKGLQKNRQVIEPWKETVSLQLTKREVEVLHLICQGNTSAGIAKKLFISIRTAENHRKNLLHKTDVKNTAGLVIYAIRHKIVDIEDV
ncbi:MAG: response regulator transcription factor [Bacteroidota bacterium]